MNVGRKQIEYGLDLIAEFSETTSGLPIANRKALFATYKDTLSLCDKGYLELAESAFDDPDPQLMDDATRLLWKNKLRFGYKHKKNEASYFRVAASVLNNNTPVGLLNSIKIVDEVEVQKTWDEYIISTPIPDTTDVLIHVGLIKPNGNRANPVEFDEYLLYLNDLGRDNALSYEEGQALINV